MRRLFFILAVVLLTLWSNSFASQKTQRILRLFDDLEEVIISVSNSIKPSVVHIEVVKKSESFKYKSLASGLIVDKDGLILTNEHVVDKAQSITVTLASKLEYSAELIGTDKLTDLALIKIKTGENLIVANLGDSEKVEVGEWVIAVGNPYGFDRTVSFGIISGIGRVLPNLPVEIQPINEFIQTDAAIDPGSSGGPLVNLKGEVIGINSVWVGRGQGFTIPINTAIEVKDKLLLSGTIERGWIGIEIQPLNRDLARYFEDEGLEGIIVSDVEPDSPAEASGLLSGDIIIEYQGERVKAEKDEDLNKFNLLISQTKPEDKAKLKIKRGENLIEMEVEIGQKPKVKPDEYETDLGFTVEEITDAMYKRYRLEDRVGVIVSYVEVGSPASKGELSESDVIIKIEDLSIETLDDFKDALEKLDNRDQFLLTVKRGKNKRFVLIIKEEEKEQQ